MGWEMTDVPSFSTRSKPYLQNTVKDANAAMVQERLYKMIEYAKGRYDWYEEQREKRVSLALGMIALSGVAMSVVIGTARPGGIDPNSVVFKLAGGLLLAIFVTAFSVFTIYLRGQNLTYTHRKDLNSIFSWYHYGVPKDTKVSVTEFSIFGKFSSLLVGSHSQETLNRKRAELSRGFDRFCDAVTARWIRNELRFDEDLQQVFVLQILQSISRDNLRLMTSALKVGASSVACLVIALAARIALVGVPLIQSGG